MSVGEDFRLAPRRGGWRRLARGALLYGLPLALAGLWAANRYLIPAEVAGHRLAPMPIQAIVSGPGTLDARTRTVVGVKTQGRLVSLAVDAGDRVAAGQVLARLDDADLKGQLAQAEAQSEVAARAVDLARADLQRAEAQLTRTRLDADRKERLSGTGVASRADMDNATAALASAEADLARARAAIPQALANLAAVRATVDTQRARLGETVLTAPFAGIVTRRDRSPGFVLSPGASLLQIVDPASLIVIARFDETVMSALTPGLAVEVRFRSHPGAIFAARIDRLQPEVDTETREIRVELVLDKPPEPWALSQRADARVVVAERADALAVPSQYVQRRQGQSGVWVDSHGHARWRLVQTGLVGATMIELRDGAAAGELILDPAGQYEGRPVRVRLP